MNGLKHDTVTCVAIEADSVEGMHTEKNIENRFHIFQHTYTQSNATHIICTHAIT